VALIRWRVCPGGAWLYVPRSRLDGLAPLDRTGLGLSIVALGALIYTIIEAPDHGWNSPRDDRGVCGRGGGHGPVRPLGSAAVPLLCSTSACSPTCGFSAASTAVTVAVLLLVRLHLPHHAVFPAAARLRPAVHRRAHPPGGLSPSPSRRWWAPSWSCASQQAVGPPPGWCSSQPVSCGSVYPLSLVSYDLIAAQMILMGTASG